MISWIDIKYKDQYADSANATGIRYKFYEYDNVFDATVVTEINRFITFLRKHYYFPIRLNILFCNTQGFKHHRDNHTYYGAFYSMDDENRKITPESQLLLMYPKTILYKISYLHWRMKLPIITSGIFGKKRRELIKV